MEVLDELVDLVAGDAQERAELAQMWERVREGAGDDVIMALEESLTTRSTRRADAAARVGWALGRAAGTAGAAVEVEARLATERMAVDAIIAGIRSGPPEDQVAAVITAVLGAPK